MNKKLNKKYLTQMNKCINNEDTEYAHIIADDILCDLLKDLGYTELIAVYEKINKWYA